MNYITAIFDFLFSINFFFVFMFCFGMYLLLFTGEDIFGGLAMIMAYQFKINEDLSETRRELKRLLDNVSR